MHPIWQEDLQSRPNSQSFHDPA